MKISLLLFGGVTIVMLLLLAAGLAYYIRLSLKRRSAIGPGWDFDRDQQPLLFWLQIAVVGWGVVSILAKAVAFTIALARFL